MGLLFFLVAPTVLAGTLSLPSPGETSIGSVPSAGVAGAGSNEELINNFRDGLLAKIYDIISYLRGAIVIAFLTVYTFSFLAASDKESALGEYKTQMTYVMAGFGIVTVAVPLANAFNVAGVGGAGANFITDPNALATSIQLTGLTIRTVATAVQYVLGALALIFMGFSAFRMATAGGDEDQINNARNALVWATLGLLLATAAVPLVDKVFAPVTPEQVLAGGAVSDQYANILQAGRSQARFLVVGYVKYVQAFVGAVAVFMLFLAGFKMVTAAGDDEVISNQRKTIGWVFLGLLIILIAETFVNIFFPESAQHLITTPGQMEIGSFSSQMGGYTNFLLTFSGALSVLALVTGGLFYSTAGLDEEQAGKGKQIMLGAALGIVITISAYALVATILSGNAR